MEIQKSQNHRVHLTYIKHDIDINDTYKISIGRKNIISDLS